MREPRPFIPKTEGDKERRFHCPVCNRHVRMVAEPISRDYDCDLGIKLLDRDNSVCGGYKPLVSAGNTPGFAYVCAMCGHMFGTANHLTPNAAKAALLNARNHDVQCTD